MLTAVKTGVALVAMSPCASVVPALAGSLVMKALALSQGLSRLEDSAFFFEGRAVSSNTVRGQKTWLKN
jgi:hypothetical protein